MHYTKLEQKLLDLLPTGKAVTHHTIADINAYLRITDKQTLNNVIHNLCRKKAVLQLKKGLYIITKRNGYDKIGISTEIYGGYIALDTALFIHGYQQSYPTIFYTITSGNRRKESIIDGSRYVSIPMKDMGFGSASINGYNVSTKAKTLFDCIYCIKYVRDFRPLLMLAKDLKKEEFEEFMYYAGKLNSTAFYERAGAIMNSVRSRFIGSLMQKVKLNPVVVKLSPAYSNKGVYISEWHVYDNIGLKRFLG